MFISRVLSNVSGRPRIYDDLEPLKVKGTEATWLNGLDEGGRKAAIYTLARCLRWRAKQNLEADPDKIPWRSASMEQTGPSSSTRRCSKDTARGASSKAQRARLEIATIR
jgi:hypothetical protein